jgi:hypothetical protein
VCGSSRQANHQNTYSDVTPGLHAAAAAEMQALFGS